LSSFVPPKKSISATRKTRKQRPSKQRPSSRADSSCSNQITPTCLQDIYGIPSDPVQNTHNGILVTGFLGEFPQDADTQVRLIV
jgi:hypothetical protein